MTDHSTITPNKYSFSFFLMEFASLLIGIIVGGLVTFFLLFNPLASPSFYRPYESIGVVDTTKLLQEYIHFLNPLESEQSLFSENTARWFFFDRLQEAIDHIKTQKKITLFDAQKMAKLPDYTDGVRKYLPLPENSKNSHQETNIRQEEDHS